MQKKRNKKVKTHVFATGRNWHSIQYFPFPRFFTKTCAYVFNYWDICMSQLAFTLN